MTRRPLIAVIGAGAGEEAPVIALAEELGRAIAAEGWALLNGMGWARQAMNGLSADAVVVCGGGGPGAASEAALAIKGGRPLVLLAVPPAWRALFTSLGGEVRCCESVAEVIAALRTRFPEVVAVDAAPTLRSTTLPVALVQLRAGADAAANRRHAEEWLERALHPDSGGAAPRLLMLPEIWNAPYDTASFRATAESLPALGSLVEEGPSPSLAMVGRFARRHGVAVLAGSIPELGADGRIYNTATVIDPEGRLRARHRKVHLFDVDVPGGIRFRESDSLHGGSEITVLGGTGDPLGTGLADPPGLGLLICYDVRFPELSLLMAQRHGCRVLACPAAFNTTTGPRHWHLVMRARALDTQCFLLACSSARPPGEGYPSYGHSLVVDPWGEVLAEAGEGEQVLHASLDLAEVERARRAIPTGQQRRSDLYRLEEQPQAEQAQAEQQQAEQQQG
ncbi:MAG: nitrilase-related carbon-nitrogen hydrolase [Prochlorococcaceae cyanobacterium]|jgi:omega-amidase